MVLSRIPVVAAAVSGLLAFFPPPLRAQDAGAVWVTTDPARVAGCAALGSQALPESNGLDALRAEAARRGANVLRLTRLSDRGIAADFYRCGPAPAEAPAVPKPAATAPVPTPVSTATPAPSPTATPAPVSISRRSSRKTPLPPSTAERQRAAREELAVLEAAVVAVSDPREVEGCAKRGEAKGAGTTEASLREAAVAALANVVLVRRDENGAVSGEYYRCPRVQYQRLLAVTPVR